MKQAVFIHTLQGGRARRRAIVGGVEPFGIESADAVPARIDLEGLAVTHGIDILATLQAGPLSLQSVTMCVSCQPGIVESVADKVHGTGLIVVTVISAQKVERILRSKDNAVDPKHMGELDRGLDERLHGRVAYIGEKVDSVRHGRQLALAGGSIIQENATADVDLMEISVKLCKHAFCAIGGVRLVN